MRKWSGMDPDEAANVPLVRVQFVTKSWPDIRKKLQKLDNWTGRSIDDLLKEAQKIYVQRDNEKAKQKGRMMVATVNELLKRQPERSQIDPSPRAPYGRGRGSFGMGFRERACFECGQKGHFKKDCPQVQKDQQVCKLMEEDESQF